MKVHRETIDVLIDLYTKCHEVLDNEYDPETEDEEALEIAALDYMTTPFRAKFCSVIDNLENEVFRELIALMWLGRESENHSPEDFEQLKERADAMPNDGNYLLAEKCLPEYWLAALERLGIN
jgi:hypothetical protein